jgi:predicted SnoaL-like aldol condensation-catalyzing enzyme
MMSALNPVIYDADASARQQERRRSMMRTRRVVLGNVFSVLMLMLIGGASALAQGNAVPASAARDVAKEERNRAFVIDFYERVFNNHDLKVAEDIVAENYIQHNPHFPTGRAAFIEILAKRFKQNPEAHARIVRSATHGDLVYLHTHSLSQPGDRGRAIVNIFRVSDGKIVEHWDVVQPVPEKAANDNTMF